MILFLMAGLSYGRSPAEESLTEGVDYAAQGKFKEAKEEFEKALEVAPFFRHAKQVLKVIEDLTDKKIESNTTVHFFKGIACAIKGQWDEAIAAYNEAIGLEKISIWQVTIRVIEVSIQLLTDISFCEAHLVIFDWWKAIMSSYLEISRSWVPRP